MVTPNILAALIIVRQKSEALQSQTAVAPTYKKNLSLNMAEATSFKTQWLFCSSYRSCGKTLIRHVFRKHVSVPFLVLANFTSFLPINRWFRRNSGRVLPLANWRAACFNLQFTQSGATRRRLNLVIAIAKRRRLCAAAYLFMVRL